MNGPDGGYNEALFHFTAAVFRLVQVTDEPSVYDCRTVLRKEDRSCSEASPSSDPSSCFVLEVRTGA